MMTLHKPKHKNASFGPPHFQPFPYFWLLHSSHNTYASSLTLLPFSYSHLARKQLPHLHAHSRPWQSRRSGRASQAALTLIGKSPGAVLNAPAGASAKTTLDTAGIAKIVGHEGEQNGAVYKITVGRDDIELTEMGAPVNTRMGLNTWAAFYGTNEDAVIAGDVAMLEDEVTPTLKSLRSHELDVVAIHHHMIGTNPVIIFLHYWGRGPADKLAAGFKAALDQSAKAGGRQ